MHTLLQDLRYHLRALRKSPVFAAVVVITLALGIGANTAIFTLINGIMLRNLPVRDPGSLVLFGNGWNCCVNTGLQRHFDLFSLPLYLEIRDNSSFSGMTAFMAQTTPIQVRLGTDAAHFDSASGKLFSANYFSVLGAEPAIGRGFQPGEDSVPGGNPLVVLTYDYWKRALNADRGILGKAINVNGTMFTVIGVAPQGFFGEKVQAEPPDMFFPLSMQPQITARESLLADKNVYWLYLMGRKKPGTDIKSTEAALNVEIKRYLLANAGSAPSEQTKKEIAGSYMSLTPGGPGVSYIRRTYREPLRILMAMVALVLLLACANIANLYLARAALREREITTRMALGASRSRLIRQLCSESVGTGILGGLLGLLFSWWATRALLVMAFSNPHTLPVSVMPDLRVLAFTVAISAITGLLFGLAPAIAAARLNINQGLRASGGQSSFFKAGRFSFGKLMVIAQVALCLLLVLGAALFSRSFARLQEQNFGFELESVLQIHIDPQTAGYKPEQLASLYTRILQTVAAVPGVRNASLAQYAPFSGNNWNTTIVVQGYTAPPGHDPVGRFLAVGPNFTSAMGMPLLLGRGIGEQDSNAAARVAVINEKFMNDYFGGRNPIGLHFAFDDKPDQMFEVVGVVRDAKFLEAREAVSPTFFLSLYQALNRADAQRLSSVIYAHEVVVRAEGNPQVVGEQVRNAIRSVAPEMPVKPAATMREQVDRTLVQDLLMTRLSSSFGVVALLLACVGLYGLMTYLVTRRTREIGIRMALGAREGHVLSMVLSEGMQLACIGVLAGLPLSFVATRLIQSQLFGTAPHDPLIALGVVVVLFSVAALAAYLPARRAMNVDPLIALRAE
jgi:macrolide transport system ATP-binding/permease protein